MYEDISIMEISMRTKTLTKTHAEDIPASFQR
ncbi:MAG: hypothetical protein ACJAVZ_004530, partial [Afipia broomeae]